MSHTDHTHGDHGPAVDHEIHTKGVVWTIVGVALTTAISMLLMVWLMNFMIDRETADDPAPSPLAEANEHWTPPGPLLQEYPPVADIEALEAHEQALTTSYGWVDEDTEVVRIPVDVALEVLKERGFPERGDVDAMSEEIFGAAAPGTDEGGGA